MANVKCQVKSSPSVRAEYFCLKKDKFSAKFPTSFVCGFTLIEVVVVSAVVLVLGQVAIPQFLGVRDRAEARAKAAAAIGIAKECATLKADDASNSGVIDPATQANVTCDQSSVAEITSQSWRVVQSVECIGSVVTATSVTLEVSATGEISCS